jgi:hypothetical protein|tara:strand:- start:3570 stop:3767 length:198 start_codon:yes stop_codon:yes gene_type:complete
MAKTVFGVLQDKITVELTAAKDHLSSGAVKDFAEYRDLCGFIRGLEVALREVNDLSRNYMEDEDD